MDIAAIKLELVDWLLQINDETQLEKIMNLKSDLDKKVVDYTINSYLVDNEEDVNQVKEADERISSGKYSTIEDLEIENYTDDKLLERVEVSIDHKDELDRRLESYKENPHDLLDWDVMKMDW